MDQGKYYLFACSWDWTYIGRFARIQGGIVIIDHAIYTIKTGARFGELCRKGLKRCGTDYSSCGNGIEIGPREQMKVHPWHAPVEWENPDE